MALDEVRDAARIVVIGDRRVFDEGAKAGRRSPPSWEFQDLKNLDPSRIKRGVASKEGGESALANYRHALRMVADGKAEAVCFTPFNKQAMRLADPTYDDEILFTAGVLGFKGARHRVQRARQPVERAGHVAHPARKEVSAHLSWTRSSQRCS